MFKKELISIWVVARDFFSSFKNVVRLFFPCCYIFLSLALCVLFYVRPLFFFVVLFDGKFAWDDDAAPPLKPVAAAVFFSSDILKVVHHVVFFSPSSTSFPTFSNQFLTAIWLISFGEPQLIFSSALLSVASGHRIDSLADRIYPHFYLFSGVLGPSAIESPSIA